MKQYVIIGGGVAAVSCVDGIRSRDPEGKITMICGEGRTAYCRPLISYCLKGKSDFGKIDYRPESYYIQNRCKLVYQKAVKIDPIKQTVTLEDGEALPYDALCAATGSDPIVPPFEGIDTVSAKYGFLTEADARALDGAVKPDSRVLIIGAGLIGLKCAEGLCGRARSVTVCDLAPRVLSSILDDTCAGFMQKKLEEHGVTFLLSDTAVRFDSDNAIMQSGRTVSFDILVLAVGVRANVSLIKDIGGECGRGIIVDDGMRTSIENIYAAGDCTEGFDASLGERRVIAILPNANMQGRTAGVNMAGGSELLTNLIPMNAIGFFGLHALSAGSPSGQAHERKTDAGIKRLYIRDGYLSGFILIGDITGAGIYTAMIREKTPLSSVDNELLLTLPSLAAFSEQRRRKVLREVV